MSVEQHGYAEPSISLLALRLHAGEMVRLENAYKDPRFNREADEKLQMMTKTAIYVPLKDSQNEVFGVMQVSVAVR
jgi:hypothetical protein